MTGAPVFPFGVARPLAACVALAFGIAGSDAALARTIGVSNCNDSGAGSLRAAIHDAIDSDVIDLGGLTCSRITLTTGALMSTANNLEITGPFHIPPSITIDGGRLTGHYDRVLFGIGTGLVLNNLAIANATYRSSQSPRGGCIAAIGALEMLNVTLDNCKVLSTAPDVTSKGGAIVAGGEVILSDVSARNNAAVSPGKAYGGAVFAYGSFFAGYSTFSGNKAYSSAGAVTAGGAVYGATGDKFEITMSTISGNSAVNGAALAIAPATPNSESSALIIESTIADNVSGSNAAIYTRAPLAIGGSTIAFNTTLRNNGYPAGLFSDGSLVEMYSTIVANNISGGVGFDAGGLSPIVGTNNLVTAATNVPLGTISACPRLSRLDNYGGHTQTIALLAGSPAIDAGIDVSGSQTDQRERPRTAGAATDIGSFELQSGEKIDPIFHGAFDSRCD